MIIIQNIAQKCFSCTFKCLNLINLAFLLSGKRIARKGLRVDAQLMGIRRPTV